MKNVPNKRQAERFRGYLQEWQRLLNLNDWRVDLSTARAVNGAMADVAPDVQARVAPVRLGGFGGDPITPYTLESTAVHELLHVLLAELIEVAKDRDAPQERLDSVEHRVINTLEQLLVPKESQDAEPSADS